MSDTSSLSELARFIGRSALSAEDPVARRRAVNEIVHGAIPRPQQQRVSDLLAVVLVLSARTRRMVMPEASVDLDVFTPEGTRAVRLELPHQG